MITKVNSMSKCPNIVFILTDQQRRDTIAAHGFDYMDTPHLDSLVKGGTSFMNMYVTAPSCAPSRASLFTGTYPHTNGVYRNDEIWSWTWVTLLNQAGYRCINVGKMHTNPFEADFGFHERHVVENKDRDSPNLPFFLDQWDKALWKRGIEKPSRVTYRRREDYKDRLGAFLWEADEDLHADVFVADLACMWLDRYSREEPFFLQVGMPGPHPPYDPTEEYVQKYSNRELPKAIRNYDFDSQPYPLRKLRENHLDQDHDGIVHLSEPTEEQLHRQRAYYYANVSMIDTQVGKIIAALTQRGVIDNTIIVFTSDHGDCLNDHGHSQKWNMYEQSVHVPAIVWGPDVKQNQRIENFTAHFDLGPTVLEAAGVTAPSWMEARSLWPELRGDDLAGREVVFAEHANDKILQHTGFMTMIRRDRWKLVHFVDCQDGQLFDLDEDPDEINNLWDSHNHSKIKQDLILEILSWRIESDKITQGFLLYLKNPTVEGMGR